jgi:small subunit ribosomal protein S1
VELENEIDGLVHISQIGEEHVEKIKDVLKVGQQVSARVIKIDREERRIGLSIKAASYDNAQLQAEISAYDRIKGTGGSGAAAAPASGTSSASAGGAGQDLNNLGDLLDKAGQ